MRLLSQVRRASYLPTAPAAQTTRSNVANMSRGTSSTNKTNSQSNPRRYVDLIIVSASTVVATLALQARHDYEDRLSEINARILRFQQTYESTLADTERLRNNLIDSAEQGIAIIASSRNSKSAQDFEEWIKSHFQNVNGDDEHDTENMKSLKGPTLI